MDGTKKLTFENVNKVNDVAGNLIKWLKAQLKYNKLIPKVEPMQKRSSELKIEFEKIW